MDVLRGCYSLYFFDSVTLKCNPLTLVYQRYTLNGFFITNQSTGRNENDFPGEAGGGGLIEISPC